MSKGCLRCCGCICCCVLFCTNIVAILIGTVFLVLGAALSFAMRLVVITQSSTISSLTSSVTSALKSNLNVDVDIGSLLTNLGDITGSIGWSFVILGAVIIVLSCFGCCGTGGTVRGCLIIYGVMVGIVLLAQLIVVIIWFSSTNLFKQNAKSAMENSVKEYTGISSMNLQSLLQNLIQIFIGCCGVNNGTDFQLMSDKWSREYTIFDSGYNFTFNLTYPMTCCKFNMSTFKLVDNYCPYNSTNLATSNYQNGCYNATFYYIERYLDFNYLFYGLAAVLGFQLLLIAGVAIVLTDDRKNTKVEPV